MTPTMSLEERVAALERQLAELQQRLNGATPQTRLEYFNGLFKDDPEFDKVVEYGRQWRQGTLPEANTP